MAFREIIRSNKTILCKYTSATVMFLDRCCEENLITDYEKNMLDLKPERYGRNREFYDVVLQKDSNSFLKFIKIMEEPDTRQSDDVLNILKNHSNPGNSIPCSSKQIHTNQLKRKNSEPESKNICFEVGEPVTSFVGREKDLVKLHGYVIRNSEKDISSVTVISQLTSVSGLGGIGKTALARKYARSYADYFDQNVIWINAETSSSMEESFTRLAEEIGVHAKNEKNQIMRDKIYKSLEIRKCLLIFDNVESLDGPNGVQKYLPKNPGVNANKPYILMTSRNWSIMQNCKVLELGVLSEEESILFVKQELKFENEDGNMELIRQLVQKLEYLPLALQQAVAYVRNLQQEFKLSGETIDPIEEYLRLFEEDSTSSDLLDYKFASQTGDDYEFTVLSTWNITISKIKSLELGELALGFMRLIAYFEPDDIRCSYFVNIFEKKKIESATNLLKKYSMIEKSGGVISVHRLVQHVIRIQNKHEKRQLLSSCLKNIVPKKIPKSGKFRQHISSIWKYSLEYPGLVSEFSRVGLQLSDGCSHKEIYERYLTYQNTGHHNHGLELLAHHLEKYYYKEKKYLTKLVEELEKQVPNAVSGWRNSLQNKTLSEWNIYRMECFAFNIEAINGLSRELYSSASDIHQINSDCYKLEKFPLEKGYEVGILKVLSKLESQDKYVATLNEFFGLTFISDEYKVLHTTAVENIISKFIKEVKYADISLCPNLQPLLQDQVNQLIRRIKNMVKEPVWEHVLGLIDLIYCLIVLNEGYEDLLKYSKDLSKSYARLVKEVSSFDIRDTEERLDFLFEFLMIALSNRCLGRNQSASPEMVEICISIWKSTRVSSAGNYSRNLIKFLRAQMGMKGVKLIYTADSSVLSSADNCIWLIQKIDSVAFELVDTGKKYEEIERNSFVEESLQICDFVSKFIGDAQDCTSSKEKTLIYVSNRTNFMYAYLHTNQIKDVLKHSDELHTFLCTVSIQQDWGYSSCVLERLEKLGASLLYKVNQANLPISTPACDLKNAAIKIYKCTWVYILNQRSRRFNLESIIKCLVQFGRVDEITNLSKEMHSRADPDCLKYVALNLAYNLLKVGKNSEIERDAFEEAHNIYTRYLNVEEHRSFLNIHGATNEILSVTMELKVEVALEYLQHICNNRDKHDLMPMNSELQEFSHSLLQQATNDGDSDGDGIRLIGKIRDTFCCIYKNYYLVNIKEHVPLMAFDSKPLVKCYIELGDLKGMQQFASELKKLHPAAKENEQLHWIVLENFVLDVQDQVPGMKNFKFRDEFLREADLISEPVENHWKTKARLLLDTV